MSRHQLRAARALLLLRQEALADLAGVGVASIRRFENGMNVDLAIIGALEAAIVAEGAILIDPGTIVAQQRVGAGVTLRPMEELPVGTKSRHAALDMTPEDAAANLPPEKANKVGRRARIPYTPSQTTKRRRSLVAESSDGMDVGAPTPPRRRG